MSLKHRWLNNSLVNLIGGLATAAVNVLLPAVVAKHLTGDSFSLWNLSLQIVAYVNLLSLGLQTATARAVAHAAEAELDGLQKLPLILSAARSIARWASAAALILVGILVVSYPLLFPGVSLTSIWDFRLTLAVFGLSAALQILAQPEMGVFQGLHRNEVFVGVQTLVRVLVVLFVWLGVQAQQPMSVLAVLMATATALLWPAMRVAVANGVPWAGGVGGVAIDLAFRRDLMLYCGTLSVWSISMLMVNSAGIAIVGRIDFSLVGPYAIAMTAASVLVGFLGAALSPLLTTAAGLYATELTRTQLPALLVRATVATSVGLNLLMVLIILLHQQIIRYWVGDNFVAATAPLLLILVGSHCLRNILAPYSMMLLASGLHKRALGSAVFEGIVSLMASILLGSLCGGVGVACGSLVGSAIGVVGSLIMNIRRTPELTPRPLHFVLSTIALPLLAFTPIYFFLL